MPFKDYYEDVKAKYPKNSVGYFDRRLCGDTETNFKSFCLAIDALAEECKQNKLSVISIGPGFGTVEAYLVSQGIAVVGIDKTFNKDTRSLDDSLTGRDENTLLKADNLIEIDSMPKNDGEMKNFLSGTVMNKLGVKNFDNTLLLIIMPPPDNKFGAYAKNIFSLGGRKEFSYTAENTAPYTGVKSMRANAKASAVTVDCGYSTKIGNRKSHEAFQISAYGMSEEFNKKIEKNSDPKANVAVGDVPKLSTEDKTLLNAKNALINAIAYSYNELQNRRTRSFFLSSGRQRKLDNLETLLNDLNRQPTHSLTKESLHTSYKNALSILDERLFGMTPSTSGVLFRNKTAELEKFFNASDEHPVHRLK